MEITNSASVLLRSILQEKNKKSFDLKLFSAGCSKKIKLELSDTDTNTIEINGVNLRFEEDAFELTSEMIIDEDNGKLVILGECRTGCSC